MNPVRPSRHRQHVALVLLLTAALLAAQWIGAMHRVVHSELLQSAHASAKATPSALLPDWAATLSHSCAAFDAATLADAVTPSAVTLPAVSNLYDIAQRVAFTSWTVPLVRPFSPRAPPLA